MSCANAHGEFVALSGLSVGARKAGLTREAVVGEKIWGYSHSREAKVAFLECLTSGSEPTFQTTTVLGGVTEHWESRFIRCDNPAEILIVATEVFPGEVPAVSEGDLRIITGLCCDMPIADVALQEGISQAAMHSRLFRLREKFGAQTNTGLVLSAIRLGVIRTPSRN